MQIQQLITQINRTVLKNRKIEYIVVHYTANNGDTAKGNCNYFLNTYRQASAHYFVDENSIWQCVEDKDSAWHVGGASKYYNGCRNINSIGIELCSRKDKKGNYYFKDETIENAIELTKMLMKKYNIDIKHVVRHYDVTKKICPAPFVRDEKAWQNFLDRLNEEELMINELIGRYGKEAVNNALVKLIESVNDDGKEAKWAENEFNEAKELGITDGTKPEMFATRQEVAIMIKRAVKQ